MNPKDQKKITKNLIKIRKTLTKDAAAITERLVEEGVLSQSVLDEIRNVHPTMSHLQCGMLINNLMRAGSEAYATFRKVLEELGHTSLVDDLENSCNKDEETCSKINARERTFVVQPQIPDRHTAMKSKSFSYLPHKQTDLAEVKEVGRMVTFVLQKFDDKDRNSSKIDFKKEFRHKLAEESKESEELTGFFRTLRHSSLMSITNESMVH